MAGLFRTGSGKTVARTQTVAVPGAKSTAQHDADLARKAVLDVVQVWLDRLQLVSVITTFFASIDGLLLSLASETTLRLRASPNDWSSVDQLTSCALASALIFHVCSAITSFTASFILIRYKLHDATQHEHIITGSQTSLPPPDVFFPRHASIPEDATPASPPHRPTADRSRAFSPAWLETLNEAQGRVSIHQVHPLGFLHRAQSSFGDDDGKDAVDSTDTAFEPPVRLLARCHTLSVTMASLGFVLAVIGILAFTWAMLPASVSICASACLGACLLVTIVSLA